MKKYNITKASENTYIIESEEAIFSIDVCKDLDSCTCYQFLAYYNKTTKRKSKSIRQLNKHNDEYVSICKMLIDLLEKH